MICKMLMTGLLIMMISASPVCANSDIDEGKNYFNDATLGSNGKSCASCHPNGKGLEQACDYDVPTLQEFVNFCIRDAMKGKMLAADDPRVIKIEKLMRSQYCKQ